VYRLWRAITLLFTDDNDEWSFQPMLLVLRPRQGSRCCDELVYVCLTLRSRITQKPQVKLHQILVHFVCGRGLVVLWRHCDTLCTSGYVDNACFHIIAPLRAMYIVLRVWTEHDKPIYQSNFPQLHTRSTHAHLRAGAKSATYDCLVALVVVVQLLLPLLLFHPILALSVLSI